MAISKITRNEKNIFAGNIFAIYRLFMNSNQTTVLAINTAKVLGILDLLVSALTSPNLGCHRECQDYRTVFCSQVSGYYRLNCGICIYHVDGPSQ